MQFKLVSLYLDQTRLVEAKTITEAALATAQQRGLYVLEIRLLWTFADIALASKDAYAINLYANPAVRALQMGDKVRLQHTLDWLQRPL